MDKAYLNVSWDKFDPLAKGLDEFLNHQRDLWAEYLNPSMQPNLQHEVAVEYNTFWEAAKQTPGKSNLMQTR